ncbi:tRNA1(Val) (adenine(37)-N6)-methyltransferase [mine drainage metagenome]|uniref:tRNA1(Val) (Adenine(37)-N6)-methyltransferase n=1 Tax=mine drainage metagenome TaxID=410659 RepID=A0A1J5SEJ1_9ZZZZ
MANSFFQFKQFTVQQEHCAMKVTTDACLFGAWCAFVVNRQPSAAHRSSSIVRRLLDIGTGTGLLSLMLAQKNSDIKIDAVEIDEHAATQAASNFQSSPWKERLQVHQTSIQQFNPSNQLFDFIISNPPFFHNDLKSDHAKRNLALHSEALSLEELLQSIKNNLTADGKFAVLLPYHRTAYFEKIAGTEKFYPEEKISVQQTPQHPFFRTMLLFSNQPATSTQKEIIIKDEFNDYSTEFKELLKDYYLYL